MKIQVGDRIGAIQKADEKTVWSFGFGTYQGEAIPPDDVPGPFLRLGLYGIDNPRLVMDDGTVVWGCESWWGSEKKIQEMIAGREVVMVKPTRSAPSNEEIAEVAESVRRRNDRRNGGS